MLKLETAFERIAWPKQIYLRFCIWKIFMHILNSAVQCFRTLLFHICVQYVQSACGNVLLKKFQVFSSSFMHHPLSVFVLMNQSLTSTIIQFSLRDKKYKFDHLYMNKRVCCTVCITVSNSQTLTVFLAKPEFEFGQSLAIQYEMLLCVWILFTTCIMNSSKPLKSVLFPSLLF